MGDGARDFAAVDGNGAAACSVARADAIRRLFPPGRGKRTDGACDGDVAAIAALAAPDASGGTAAGGDDVAMVDDDVSASDGPSAADAGAGVVALGLEGTIAFDGEGLILGNENAGVMRRESLDEVLAFEREGAIAL